MADVILTPKTVDEIEFFVSADGKTTGVSISGLARLCGVSHQTMSRLCSNLEGRHPGEVLKATKVEVRRYNKLGDSLVISTVEAKIVQPNFIIRICSRYDKFLLTKVVQALNSMGVVYDKDIVSTFVTTKTRKTNLVKGVIYILADYGNNAYKIGFSTNWKKRLESHKTSHPFLEIVATYPPDFDITFEKHLHSLLSSYRIKDTTEWYRICPDVIKIVETAIALQSSLS